jgi:transcriptional regulator with PAS, ATPase and Fis domain
MIDVADLGLPAAASSAPVAREGDTALGSLEEMEKDHIQKVINNTDNLSKAAEVLGITRSTLYSKIRRYKLD